MSTDHRARLAAIKRFDQLIAYLRDEMGWPIARDSFEAVDDLFYDFTADELGIDPKTAARIQEIKRLRPLSAKQPWGIFFVKFEPKRLPIVALRRILSQVALKKRASANSAERAAWSVDDLLFISNFGEGDERQISFAHFSRPPVGDDLPTLKVLGWDNRDTALHLDAVARELSQHLAWPDDDADAAAWRARWRSAFTLGHREVVTTSKELSIRLAGLARGIRDRIKAAIAIESEGGQLTKLMKAFRTALVHDLDADGFADMYAQTIAYGLLSARIADPKKRTVDDFASHMRTNPFLRELMETFLKVGGRRGTAGGPGIDFDELGVSEVVELLDDANMEAVVRDFGDRNPQEDPVIHFYELFLEEYDAEQRMQRGVFYTPRPVVSYIVRSVDEMLRTEFGLLDGLADTTTWQEIAARLNQLKIPNGVSPDQDFVQILDPATGTGTFLVEVIDLIHRTLVTKWRLLGHSESKIEALWNEYVPRHLLTRLHGYELLMAPYAIAHLKIGLKLYETGYRFGSEERARVYLTNALEPAPDITGTFDFAIPALAHEAMAVNEIKRNQRFTAVIGNPPYSNFGQLNKIPFILGLIEDYKRGLDEKKLNLDDDFIKFMRFAQHLLDNAGLGIFGMITNNVFIDGITHRRMRASLLESYADIYIFDLHGSSKKLESASNGSKEENVFDIQQGVGIFLFVKKDSSHTNSVRHAQLWGTRDSKYNSLGQRTFIDGTWTQIDYRPPHYFFVPKSFHGIEEYQRYPSMAGGIFRERNAGIQTKRDGLVYSFTKQELEQKLSAIQTLSSKALMSTFALPEDGRDWAIQWAKDDVRKGDGSITKIAYHPFDSRWTYFTGRTKGLMAYPRTPLMWSALKPNRLLLTVRNPRRGNVDSFFVGSTAVDKDSVSPFDNATFFPLYIYHDQKAQQQRLGSKEEREVNFYPAFLKTLCVRLNRPARGSEGLPSGLTPEDIFHYIYAVFYSPSYRGRYAEFLKIDFPRVPLTGHFELFRKLAVLGNELTALHLLESPTLTRPITEFIGGHAPDVEKISWSKNTVWLDKALTVGFKGVREEVWTFQIGGYQVCEKWLKDRKGRNLTNDDIVHYQKIVAALSQTVRLMKEIDEVIEQHGGWPGAFATSDNGAAGADEGAGRSAYVPDEGSNVVTLPIRSVRVRGLGVIGNDPPIRQVAEEGRPYDAGPGTSGEADSPPQVPERAELICVVRQSLSADGPVDRDAAIDAIARSLGFRRTGSRIREEIDNALLTAVRRGIAVNDGGVVRIDARVIGDYDRSFLKDQFIASLEGGAWQERTAAIRGFARWLGFRRTGPGIEDAARSLINGLLREGRLEADGDAIRRV